MKDAELRQDDGAEATEGDGRVEALKQTIADLKRKLSDQRNRIDALARGREEGMATISKLRAELALVVTERDRLRQQLTELESMQTETVAIGDGTDTIEARVRRSSPASIDELMSTFTGEDAAPGASHLTMKVDSSSRGASDEYQEMISPDVLVLGSTSERGARPAGRSLSLSQDGNQTEFPLNEDLMTIGRSESADIQVEGDFISRIHARVLRIGMETILEDARSMNGTWVNDAQAKRRVLKDGDRIRIGSANFRYNESGHD